MIFAFPKVNVGLQALWLDDRHIGTAGVLAIAEALKVAIAVVSSIAVSLILSQVNAALQTLHLPSDIGADCAEAIGEALKVFSLRFYVVPHVLF